MEIIVKEINGRWYWIINVTVGFNAKYESSPYHWENSWDAFAAARLHAIGEGLILEGKDKLLTHTKVARKP